MSENPNFIVQLFIRTLSIKHKLTFQKDKQEYFRVLFDTYLNGQGNPAELKDYIAAGIEDQKTIDIIAQEVIEWQAKAGEMKAAQEAKKQEQLAEKAKMEEYTTKKTAKAKEQHEQERKEKGEEHGKKRHKGQHKPKNEANNQGNKVEGEAKGDQKGLKFELTQQGKQKCKFFPFCKNPQTCQYFHPTEKCTYFPKCRFGDSCLYEHETCKFKEKCTKMNCPFAHPFKKSNPLEEMMKSFMSQHNPLSRPKKKFNPKNKEHTGEQPAQEQPKKQ